MTYTAKRLDKSSMDKIQQLEKKLDYCVVAWEKTPRVASLSDSQIEDRATGRTVFGLHTPAAGKQGTKADIGLTAFFPLDTDTSKAETGNKESP